MKIFKISKKHLLYHFFKYFWSIFWTTFKKEVKNWQGPLAIKTKKITKKYFVFKTFF